MAIVREVMENVTEPGCPSSSTPASAQLGRCEVAAGKAALANLRYGSPPIEGRGLDVDGAFHSCGARVACRWGSRVWGRGRGRSDAYWDISGGGATWEVFDNHEAVFGCTSQAEWLATGEFLPGYGPFDAFDSLTGDVRHLRNGHRRRRLVPRRARPSIARARRCDAGSRRPDGGPGDGVAHRTPVEPDSADAGDAREHDGRAVTKVVTFEQDLGSDGETWIQTTSSGDDLWAVDDRWSISADAEAPTFTDPVVSTVLYGPGAIASPQTLLDLCGLRWGATARGRKPGGIGEAATQDDAAQTSASYFEVAVPRGRGSAPSRSSTRSRRTRAWSRLWRSPSSTTPASRAFWPRA